MLKMDYCGIVHGSNADKSSVFDTFYGALKTASMIGELPASLEYRPVKSVALPAHTLFIREIVAAYADGDIIVDGKLDFPAMGPMFLTTPDNLHWTLGRPAGEAWSVGKRP